MPGSQYPTLPEYEGIPQVYQSNVSWVPNASYQGGGYYSSEGGFQYDIAQLEKLWIDAGGDPAVAPDMAYIARYDESGGYGGAWNSSGATGLWQVEWPSNYSGSRQDLFTPIVNARQAVALYKASGFSPWGNDPYQNLGIPPATSVPYEFQTVPGGSKGGGGNDQQYIQMLSALPGTYQGNLKSYDGMTWVQIYQAILASNPGINPGQLAAAIKVIYAAQSLGKSTASGEGTLGNLISTSETAVPQGLNPSNWLNINNWLGGLIPNIGDYAQRFGLIILGGALVLLGIYMLTGSRTFKLVTPEGVGSRATKPKRA